MIRHKSTEKRARQNKKRYQSNRAVKSSVKTGVKNLLAAIDNKNKEGSSSQLKKVISTLNKAASKGIVHKKTVSRKISRLTKRTNKAANA
jgi:small subunit ribosomal protein S20